jgi:hypothetical protein
MPLRLRGGAQELTVVVVAGTVVVVAGTVVVVGGNVVVLVVGATVVGASVVGGSVAGGNVVVGGRVVVVVVVEVVVGVVVVVVGGGVGWYAEYVTIGRYRSGRGYASRAMLRALFDSTTSTDPNLSR